MGRLWTVHGYTFGESTSAMQKCIRRSDVDGALYWSHELATKFHRYVWMRLAVILNEDIGLANLGLFVPFARAAESGDLAQLASVVTALAQSAKSRLADHAQAAIFFEQEHGLRAVPPHPMTALRQGMAEGDEEHALDGGLALYREEADDALWRIVHDMGREIGASDDVQIVLSVIETQYRQQAAKNRKSGCKLMAANAVLLLCRRAEGGSVALPDVTYTHVCDERAVPDVALDKHTGAGKRLGRGVQHFLDEGTWLAHPSPDVADPYRDRAAARWLAIEAAGKTEKKAKKARPRAEAGAEQLTLL